MNEDIISKVLTDAYNWVVSSIQVDGLLDTIIAMVVMVALFGGMTAIFGACAYSNKKSLENNDKNNKCNCSREDT